MEHTAELLNSLSEQKNKYETYYKELYADYEKYAIYDNLEFSDYLTKVFPAEKRSFFTVCSKESFNMLESNKNWQQSIIFSPLNDHSRSFMHKGDIVFCYRQGQFDDLKTALNQRGIYALGIVASEPKKLFPELEKHNAYGVAILFPFPLKKHLELRNIQLDPITISLTPYNGNRNDALQYIPEEEYYEELLNLICAKNHDIKSIIEKIINKSLKTINLPDDLWNKQKRETSSLIPHPRNRILFGAPGTGKSHKLNEEADKYFKVDSSNIFIRDEKIENQIKKEFQESTEEDGAIACKLAIKYYNYFSCLRNTIDKDYKGFILNLFELNAKQPELIVATIKGIDLLESPKKSNNFIERVTFHPNYSYANFVGTYKPVQDKTDSTQIKYEYVPGPFMRTFAKAKLAEKNHTGEKFLLIIEEINRANVAAVFGDVFQLLDRDENGKSEYPINASEDIKNFLIKEHKFTEEEVKTLSIPKNMYIWATMNSADQGVFPMDTAFKRRWEFEYIGIDDGADDKNNPDYKKYKIPLQIKRDENNNPKEILCYNWDLLRRKINESLLKNANYINEDKLLGPYFLNKTQLENIQKELKDNCEIEKIESFLKSFKSKVLMYLFEDVVKMRPQDFFDCQERSFSIICEKFNEEGLAVFKDIKEDETFKSESFSNKK